jgi:hypothetical protein
MKERAEKTGSARSAICSLSRRRAREKEKEKATGGEAANI